ncbi:HAD hydrolase-like protein [Kribbella qitaiheensis]|uniref:HAD hydrolase-like protein n=1 Tax=Kribbella qitaiheensis TaxID=1544730 RepID=UPI0019D57FB1|nr:HAD hydrolase-like protein [Kribbella qitaiheensis]
MFVSNSVSDPGWPRTRDALQAAGAERQSELREVGYVLPGVREVLQHIRTRAEVIQAVVTGNIVQNAALKLATFALEDFFDLDAGAYGGDSEDRHDLVRLAKIRAERLYDAVFDEKNTTVIGDTPRDVEAAHEGGARIVAVATGVDSEWELRAAGAHLVLQDLSDVDQAVSVILGR